MIRIKRILCPVDFFPASENAAKYAVDLAGAYGAKVHLLHVVTPILPTAYEYPLNTVEMTKSMQDAAAAQMKKLVARLKTKDVKVGSELRIGDVHDAIKRALAAIKPDMVVMGTHGRHGVERLVLGSVTDWLIRNSTAPVMVIPSLKKTISKKTRRARRAA